MIKLQMIGHLGKNAIRGQVNGKSVLNFNVAHSEKYKNHQGEDMQRTTWVECSLWEREALAPYLLQGAQVFIEGLPHLDSYVNRKGETTPTLRLRITSLQLLGKRDAAEATAQAAEAAVQAGAEVLPF